MDPYRGSGLALPRLIERSAHTLASGLVALVGVMAVTRINLPSGLSSQDGSFAGSLACRTNSLISNQCICRGGCLVFAVGLEDVWRDT